MVAVLQPANQGRIIPIDRAVILVGRSADCDAVVTGSQKISRRHCCLVQVDNEYYVRDLGSMNGVWLNGNKVKRSARLTAGDNLSIGDVEFLFHPNARIEQKKTVPGQADSDGLAKNDFENEEHNEQSVPSSPEELTLETDDSIEVIDDVIPLDQIAFVDDEEDAEILTETNEVEAIDAPIVDSDAPILKTPSGDSEDLGDLDEIIVYED